jgi:hypothetical protein
LQRPFFECTRTGIAEGDSGFACWLLSSIAGGENNARQRMVYVARLAAADALAHHPRGDTCLFRGGATFQAGW